MFPKKCAKRSQNFVSKLIRRSNRRIRAQPPSSAIDYAMMQPNTSSVLVSTDEYTGNGWLRNCTLIYGIRSVRKTLFVNRLIVVGNESEIIILQFHQLKVSHSTHQNGGY